MRTQWKWSLLGSAVCKVREQTSVALDVFVGQKLDVVSVESVRMACAPCILQLNPLPMRSAVCWFNGSFTAPLFDQVCKLLVQRGADTSATATRLFWRQESRTIFLDLKLSRNSDLKNFGFKTCFFPGFSHFGSTTPTFAPPLASTFCYIKPFRTTRVEVPWTSFPAMNCWAPRCSGRSSLGSPKRLRPCPRPCFFLDSFFCWFFWEIFTPLRVGWPPTPRLFYVSFKGLRGAPRLVDEGSFFCWITTPFFPPVRFLPIGVFQCFSFFSPT